MGYWNDLERTAERFRPFPSQGSSGQKQEIAVWSGDTVRMDQDGFLYFVGRQDDMIKTSGYRVSPSEVEEVLYETDEVAEAAVVGAPHPTLGEGIVAIVKSRDGCKADVERLLQVCRRELPAYMVPKAVRVRNYLPLTANGKVDRQSLRAEVHDIFAGADST
jgi:acyl-coenzyme A synthetase/AMP-(fatty) acid ligase